MYIYIYTYIHGCTLPSVGIYTCQWIEYTHTPLLICIISMHKQDYLTRYLNMCSESNQQYEHYTWCGI